MKIGLVGEAPNDTLSLQNLLTRKYSDNKIQFFSMLKIQNGSTLDSSKTYRLLEIENKIQKPDLIIFIRDLDSVLPNRAKQLERLLYFRKANRRVKYIGLFLLHIYEIEALILADIETFNTFYNVKISKFDNVMKIAEPKEVLKAASKNYSVSDNSKIFNKLRIDKLLECQYFEKFILELDRKIMFS